MSWLRTPAPLGYKKAEEEVLWRCDFYQVSQVSARWDRDVVDHRNNFKYEISTLVDWLEDPWKKDSSMYGTEVPFPQELCCRPSLPLPKC